MSEPRGTNQAFATSVADELARCGVRHVCFAPGSRSGPLALAFEGEPRLQTHVHLDERSAAFFALGVGRATSLPAVVLCTSGTAAANLFPAIVEAKQASVPLVALTADRPPELRATGANQTIDQIKMFGESVVWFAEAGVPDEAPTSPAYWRSVTCRAVMEASTRRGPVHVNVALRDPLYPSDTTDAYPFATEGREGGRPWTELFSAAPAPSEPSVAELARMIQKTERGVVVAGATADDLHPLCELASAAGWPVLAEPASNIRVPGTISTYDALLRSDRFVAAHRPDIVLRVGKLALGRPLARFLNGSRQVSIGRAENWLDEQRKIEAMLHADPAALCSRVSAEITPRARSDWHRSWQENDAIARRAIDEVLDSTDSPTEPRAARDVATALPEGANLFAAASMPIRDLDSFMVPRNGISIHANRGTNGIDGNISTTFGIAVTTGTPTAALIGDLALLHDSNGMLYEGKDDLAVTFVVINNQGGGIFSFLEQAGLPLFERVFGTPHGVDLHTWADLYGVGSSTIDRASDLAGLVGSHDGVGLVEVRTDREENVMIHRAIWQEVEDALASAS